MWWRHVVSSLARRPSAGFRVAACRRGSPPALLVGAPRPALLRWSTRDVRWCAGICCSTRTRTSFDQGTAAIRSDQLPRARSGWRGSWGRGGEGEDGGRFVSAATFAAVGLAVATCAGDGVGRERSPGKRLMSAARHGNAAEIKSLVSELEADPNERHAFGWTALHVAAVNGEAAAVRALLEAGADPDAGDDYSTAFRVGRDRRIPAVEAMIVREKEFSDLLNNAKSYKNSTALHYAVLADSEPCVAALLDAGANPLELNSLGHRPIEYAVPDSPVRAILEKAEKEFADKLREKEAEERRRYPLEGRLKEKIVGQEAAIACVAAAIRRKENGWVDDEHPLVFLFLGSSGIGKTELAKQVAHYLHGRKKKADGSFIRLDMSEYQEKHEVAKLIGAPPGYVGHDDGGNLTKRLAQYPNAVVLFDEIDKAHPDVLTVLLQLFDEGRLTDGKGKTIECKDAIFIMTSNLASDEIASYAEQLRREVKAKMRERYDRILSERSTTTTATAGTGTGTATATATATEEAEMARTEKRLSEEMVTVTDDFKERVVRPILKRHFRRDEFLGRINEMIYFLPFSQTELLELTDREMVAWAKRASDRHGVTLSWTKDVLTAVACGYNVHYGARSIKHEVERKIVGPIAAAHEQRKITTGSAVFVSVAEPDADVLLPSDKSPSPSPSPSAPQVRFAFKIKQPGKNGAVEVFVPDRIASKG